MKDDYIRIKIDSKKKEKFKEACDGRTMSVVIEKFIDQYIEDQKGGKK